MRCEVRLMGGLVERAGASRVPVELPEDATVADLRAAVAAQHPRLASWCDRVSVALDLEVARDTAPVSPAAEVALLPPVAGGAPDPGGDADLRARRAPDGRLALTGLRPPPLELGPALAAIAAPGVGGTATFVGTVRDHAPDLEAPVVRLDYEAYPAMAERVLAEIADEVLAEWPAVRGVALLHTVGELEVGDHTILIACAAAHRGDAFDACREALERVKDRVPVFKREVTADGDHRWVGMDEEREAAPLGEPGRRR